MEIGWPVQKRCQVGLVLCFIFLQTELMKHRHITFILQQSHQFMTFQYISTYLLTIRRAQSMVVLQIEVPNLHVVDVSRSQDLTEFLLRCTPVSNFGASNYYGPQSILCQIENIVDLLISQIRFFCFLYFLTILCFKFYLKLEKSCHYSSNQRQSVSVTNFLILSHGRFNSITYKKGHKTMGQHRHS